jgi:hypothetical protein
MKVRACLFVVVAMLLSGSSAFAWNCSDPLASRVDVGATKPGTGAGDGDGQWYRGSDAKNPTDYYVCEVPQPPTTGVKNKSKSTSTSNSAATVGPVSSYSGVSNSGNSFNMLTYAASQNQTQSSTNTNTATNLGNNSSQSTTFEQVHQTASAIAPETFPTSPCFKTISGAGQGGSFGLSFGAGKIDEGCDARETARLLASIGSKTAACKLIVSTKAAKNANVTLADCLKN